MTQSATKIQRTTTAAFNPSISPDVYTTYELITPERAAELLEKNVDNRPISETVVASYTQLMAEDEWPFTHQGIAIGKDDTVYDGQHRLWAVFRSGKTIPFLVTYNLAPEARGFFDSGRKRSVADNARILAQGDDKNLPHARMMEAINVIWGLWHRLTSFTSNISIYNEVMSSPFKEGVLWAAALPRVRCFMPAPVRGALAFAHREDPEGVQLFAHKLLTGLEIGHARDPAGVLRTQLAGTKIQGNGTERRRFAVKTLRAIYAHLYEGSISKIYETEDAVAFFGRANGLTLAGSSAEGLRAFTSRGKGRK